MIHKDKKKILAYVSRKNYLQYYCKLKHMRLLYMKRKD